MVNGKIYIAGAGDHAKVVIDQLLGSGRRVAGAFDVYQNSSNIGKEILGVPVIDVIENIEKYNLSGSDVVIAVGDNGKRQEVYEFLKDKVKLVSSISVSAIISPNSEISSESVTIMPGAIVNVSAKVGKCAIINTGAVVEHDCVVGDFAHVAPGSVMCGSSSVGAGTLLGTGSVVRNGVSVGSRCVIGAGSVVVKDVPDGVVAYGVPAKPVK